MTLGFSRNKSGISPTYEAAQVGLTRLHRGSPTIFPGQKNGPQGPPRGTSGQGWPFWRGRPTDVVARGKFRGAAIMDDRKNMVGAAGLLAPSWRSPSGPSLRDVRFAIHGSAVERRLLSKAPVLILTKSNDKKRATRARFCHWSGRRDSNPRPPAPQADALPGCATPRPNAHDSGTRTITSGITVGAAVVKSQAMEGRSGVCEATALKLAKAISDAAITDDRKI